MRKLRDSGMEWIGDIPAEWEMKRLKAIFLERKEKNDPQQTDFILSLGAAYGVVPYSEKEGGGNKAKEDLTAYRLAYPDDIVMNSMNIISGSVGISKYFGCVSPVYYILHPRLEGVNQHYYCYMFQTKAFQRSLLGLGNGILMKETESGNFNTVRMRIPMEKLGVQLLPFPSEEEQHRIADFLDRVCADIDAVIASTKATIEEYKALKQAIITEAVTKGIRGDRPMKDSGIEWIGTFPEKWTFAELKMFCKVNNGKEISNEVHRDTEGAIGVYGSGGVFKYTDNYMFDGTTVMFGRKGTLGKPLYVTGKVWVVDTMYYLTYSTKLIPKFNYYQLWAFDWQPHITQTALPSIVASQIVACKFAIPDLQEQEEIINFLDNKCAEIDKLIADKTHLLEEMEQYKKSVIYEYVTGKKEVAV